MNAFRSALGGGGLASNGGGAGGGGGAGVAPENKKAILHKRLALIKKVLSTEKKRTLVIN